MPYILPETNLFSIKKESREKNQATFIIEPLSPGYGVTVGNSLRRVLISSLSGAAISSVRIDGVPHEFSTLKGMKEDVVELLLNLKEIRFKLLSEGPVTLQLKVSGPVKVKAGDFKSNPEVEVINCDHYLCSLDKGGSLSLEVNVEKGRGYIPVERRKEEKLPLGTIAIDSIFTPLRKVHFEVENTRVGGITNFDKLTLDITTDGTISPEGALKTASQILLEHFGLVEGAIDIKPPKEKIIKKAVKKVKVKKTVKAKSKKAKK